MVKASLLNIDNDETIVVEIKRHPWGLVQIYGGATLIIALTLGVLYLGLNAPGAKNASSSDNFGVMLAAVSFIVLVVLLALIAGRIYKTNELIITNENIIQILQFGLFNRQISQLNLSKIQDVSVDQVGIIQSMFNYGTIDIETAGEQSNYRFKYASNPNVLAKTIIEAHEDYVKKHSTNLALDD